MSQADIPHGAETGARLGNRLFVAGVALYLVALAACYAVLGVDSERGSRALGVLIAAPLGFIAITLILLQVAVIVGFLSSVPHASWAYAVAAVRRDWKILVGILLILTTLAAVLAGTVISWWKLTSDDRRRETKRWFSVPYAGHERAQIVY
jgi:hypothetical protein